MNYSLDALWWKLTDAKVRDLASLLTAPPLWHTACELSVRELLGEHGFRCLLALDQNPQPLHDYLACRNHHNRLGLYAEHLLAFWFEHAPHTQLLAHNLNVVSDGLTVGATDFVVLLNHTPYHIELTCKYYGGTGGRIADWCGLNRDDRMAGKIAKLPQQLMLLKFSDGLKTLQQQGLPTQLHTASIVRGIGFFTPSADALEAPINPHGWHGTYLADWPAHSFDNPQQRYALLNRMNYLAPARLSEAETQTAAQIQAVESGLIAVLEKRPDDFWHETARLMKISDGLAGEA